MLGMSWAGHGCSHAALVASGPASSHWVQGLALLNVTHLGRDGWLKGVTGALDQPGWGAGMLRLMTGVCLATIPV